MQKLKFGFTLVELIVVITILAILATIAFLSLQNYSKQARDSVRISDLTNIYKGFQLYNAKNGTYPRPDNYITINGLGYQGYVGENVKNIIKVGGELKDPLDNNYFTYLLSEDNKKIQLAGFLEVSNNISFINDVYAGGTDYTKRYIYLTGDKIGISLDSTTKAPIQEILTGSISLSSYTGTLLTYLSNTQNISGTGGEILTKLRVVETTNTNSTTTKCELGTTFILGNCGL